VARINSDEVEGQRNLNVFISWSGRDSRLIGSTLTEFLPNMIPSVTTWMSEKDIPPGGLWGSELHHHLAQAEYAVICVTSDNTVAPWLLYELGCLAMRVPIGSVVPLLHGIESKDLPAPLNSFHAVSANGDGVWKLVQSANAATKRSIQVDALRIRFEQHWPALELRWAGFLDIKQVSKIQVVSIRRLRLVDEYDVAMIRRRLQLMIKNGNCWLVLDLEQVQALSSSAIGAFLLTCRTAETSGGKIVFANVCTLIREFLSTTRIDQLLEIYDNIDQVISALDSRANRQNA
jgi:anti-anti-sigma factor